MTLEGFVKKWLGKKADYDNFYGGQCVDLYRFYVKEVLGFPQSPPVRGASNIWDTIDQNYFEKISNEPTAVPEPGDIVIWNTNAGGGYGHVAIFLDGDVNSFTSLDQNWPTLSKVTKTKHNYSNVIGWLRPKGEHMADDALQACLKDREKFWKERDEAKEELAKANEEIAKLKERIQQERKAKDTELENQKNEMSQQCDIRVQEARERLVKEIEALKSQVSKLKEGVPPTREDLIKRFTSRKFIVSILALLVPIANKYLDLGMDAAEIIASLSPIMAFIGFEGWTDHKERMLK